MFVFNILVCAHHIFTFFHQATKAGTKICVRVGSQGIQGIFPITWPAVWWSQDPALSSPKGSSQSPGAGGASSPGSRSPGSWGHWGARCRPGQKRGHCDSGQRLGVSKPLSPLDQCEAFVISWQNVFKERKEQHSKCTSEQVKKYT